MNIEIKITVPSGEVIMKDHFSMISNAVSALSGFGENWEHLCRRCKQPVGEFEQFCDKQCAGWHHYDSEEAGATGN